ncbi:MAG: carboxypeptidase-like regulatory domain-containing protein, partial [Candidatus Woesearchaeota archaeon]
MLKSVRNGIAGLAMLVGSILPSFGQNYTLSGKITELERITGAAQKEVRVDIDSSKFIAFTNADGTYSIPGIPAGTHNIRISKPGFVGFFKKDYNLDGDKAFDVCLADTIQESPNGTQVLKV